jgi:hypothetical protein
MYHLKAKLDFMEGIPASRTRKEKHDEEHLRGYSVNDSDDDYTYTTEE